MTWKLAAASLLVLPLVTAQAQQRTGKSGLPLPRFVSLKSNPVNLRTGPGRQYPKAWVFRRAGLPVEVYEEYGNWRRVRDSEGASGWILRALLSGRRTALVLPWNKAKSGQRTYANLLSRSRTSSSPVAKLEAGSLVSIRSCDGRWCAVAVSKYRGFIEQKLLWGVYKDEELN
ncbi:MAG: SH3 domain-containing protein [Pseudomonadota bacterium]